MLWVGGTQLREETVLVEHGC